jgi:uncharacterized protein YkwD
MKRRLTLLRSSLGVLLLTVGLMMVGVLRLFFMIGRFEQEPPKTRQFQTEPRRHVPGYDTSRLYPSARDNKQTTPFTKADQADSATESSVGLDEEIPLTAPDPERLDRAIRRETNRARRDHGLSDLAPDSKLRQAASKHAGDMVTHDFFCHTSPLPSRKTLSDRVNSEEAKWTLLAENIAGMFGIVHSTESLTIQTPAALRPGFFAPGSSKPIPNHTYSSLARSVVEGWMNSPGHRANILNPDLTCLGSGGASYLDADFHQVPRWKLVQVFSAVAEP